MQTNNHVAKSAAATKSRIFEVFSITILTIIAFSHIAMIAFVLHYGFVMADSKVVSRVLNAQAINQALLVVLVGSARADEIVSCAIKVTEKILRKLFKV